MGPCWFDEEMGSGWSVRSLVTARKWQSWDVKSGLPVSRAWGLSVLPQGHA